MANDLETARTSVTGQEPANPEADEAIDPLRVTALRYHTEFPWSDPNAIEVNLGIFRASRVVGAAMARYLDARGLGISRARYTVLRTLFFAQGNRMPQNEIGREMGVSKTNVTNLIDGLEKDNLVVRIANPADRRVTYAQLTPAGKELCAALMPAITKFMEDICRDFSTEERVMFKDFLSRIWRAVESFDDGQETVEPTG
jgi:MarR family 2-MHQ and catechol resistance regulon transcriptional repressor